MRTNRRALRILNDCALCATWIATLLLGTGCLGADEWPRWRGPSADGHASAGVKALARLPETPRVVWQVPVGPGFGSPVASRGLVFYLDSQQNRETVHAAELASGRERWRASLDEAFKDTQGEAGPRGTPLAEGDRVYVQSCRGEFQCLRVADGSLLWRVNFVKDFQAYFLGEMGSAPGASRHGNTGSPIIAGERLIVSVGGTNGASVVCFNKLNGQVLWQSQKDIPGHSGPLVVKLAGREQVVCFTAEAVIGLALQDGRLLWRVPVQTRLGRHVVTPVVVDDMVVVASFQAGLIGIRVTPAGDGMTAERRWVNKALAFNVTSPVAVGACLYGLAPGRKLVCVDVRTGEVKWEKRDVFSSPLDKDGASFVVLEHRILVLGFNGELMLLEADAAECRLMGRARVCGNTWCSPAYVNGQLIVRDEQELRCVQLE